jgi:hypothetical protein
MLRRALLLVPSVLRSCRLSAAINATTTSADSSRARTQEVSPGKDLNFPLGPSGSTCSVLMRIGFRAFQHADRPLPASLPVRVPMVAGLPAASFSSTLAGVALRFSYGCSHQLRCHRFMSLVKAHAGHTGTGVPPVISEQARHRAALYSRISPQASAIQAPLSRPPPLSQPAPIPKGLRPIAQGWPAARRPTLGSLPNKFPTQRGLRPRRHIPDISPEPRPVGKTLN